MFYSDCFPSDLRCEDYYYTLMFSRAVDENDTDSDLANVEDTIPCVLFCHQKYLLWQVLHCLAAKGGSFLIIECKKF